mgnify:CR=1 FL=1
MNIGPFYFDTKEIFGKYPEVKLAYLFGSQAGETAGPMSDYDFAIYFDENTSKKRQFDIRLIIASNFSKILKNNNVEVVVLNDDLEPLLKYQVIKNGKIIFEQKPYRLILEPKIYSEFFDYQVFSQLNNL